MDITSLLSIVVVLALTYIFVKLVVSPVLKVAVGIIIFIIMLYLVQKFFGFDVSKLLKPFGISLTPSQLGTFDWILDQADYYINKVKSFF